MALLGVTILTLWLGQLLVFFFFPRSIPKLLWYLVNGTEPLTGVRVQWTEVFEADDPDGTLSGSDDGETHEVSERALLINCEKGRVSSIVIRNLTLPSLRDLLFHWKCEILVEGLHINLRRQKKKTGVKRKPSSRPSMRKFLKPWFWRYLLRCISLVVPDTFLNASIISITDTKAHKKTTVENVIAQIIGKGIWNMTAGAVVTRVVVTDTEPAFSQRLVSIDSICVQWETENNHRVLQNCSVVLGKTIVALAGHDVMSKLAMAGKSKKGSEAQGSKPRSEKLVNPSAFVTAALAEFTNLPESFCVYCTTLEVSAPLGGYRAVAPGVKHTRKRRHSLMHVALSPPEGTSWAQEATIPYLATCMRLLRLREKLSSKPGRSFSTAIDTPTHAAESLFGKPAGFALKLQTAYAAPPDHASAPESARASTQPQSAAPEKHPSAALDSSRSKQAPTLQSMLPFAASSSAEMHEQGSSSQQLSQMGNPLGDSSEFAATSGNISSSGVRANVSEITQNSAQGISDAVKGSAVANPLDPSAFGTTTDVPASKQEADEGADGYMSAQEASGAGSSATAGASDSGLGSKQTAGAPKLQTAATPREKKKAVNLKNCRRTVSVVMSTGVLTVAVLGGGVAVYNGASKSSILLDGPAEGKAGELQALSVAMGAKDIHAAVFCASLWSFEETHRILQMLSDPTVSQLGVSISPSAQSATAQPENSLECAPVGNPAAVSTEIGDAEAAVTTPANPASTAAQKKQPINNPPPSARWSLSQLDNSASGEQPPAPRGLQKVQQMTAAALKSTSWQLNLQLDDDASLLVVDGGTREAEKLFGKPGAPRCRSLIWQCGRSVAAVGAAPEGCILPIEVAGYEKVTTISSLASPFVVAQLPAHASNNAPTFLPTSYPESLVDRQIKAAATPEVQQKISGGERFAVVATCQDVCTAFTTAFSNEMLGLAAAHKPLWEDALQAVSPTDQWDFENLAEGPQEGLSGARLLHLLQQDHVLQHAVSWSHLSFEFACNSTEKDFAGPYEVSTAIGLAGLYADLSPHQAMDTLEAAISLKQLAQSYRTRKSSRPKTPVLQDVAAPAYKPEIAAFYVRSELTDCQVTWSQLAAQQLFGSSLPSSASAAQNLSQGSQISLSTSAISASNKSFLSLPAHSRSLAPGSSGVHFLFLHDCWTLASLNLDGAYSKGEINGTVSVEGASWGCQWQELRGGLGQKLLDVYSVSSPRFLPHISGMDPGELYRLLSPDLDMNPVRFDLTDSDLMPCSFVARRRQAVFFDDRFHDAPSVTHVPALRLHQALVQSDARRVCGIGSMHAQAADLVLEDPWVSDSNPSSSETHGHQGLTVDIQDCNAELDIDIGLIHIAAAQHVTRLADWLAKLIATAKPQPQSPKEPVAAGKLLSAKLQPRPGTSVPPVVATGSMSTQSSTISASYDIQNGSASMEQLSSAVSMHTAASLTPAPSGPSKVPKKAIKKILEQVKASLKGISASCAIGGRDTVNLQFDGWATEAGESWKFHSLSVFMNGCSVIEALDVGAQIRMRKEVVTGVEDLQAEVKTVSLNFTGRTAVFFVPHSQDPGRLYAFSRMWEKPVLQVVKSHMQDLKESVAHAKTLLKRQDIRSASSNASIGAATSPSAAGLAGNPMNGSVIPEEGGKKASAKLRISLSCDMSELALRIENHSLERKLTLLYPVRRRTAALQTALKAAMQTYTNMHETSMARATGKRSERSDKSVVNEPELPEAVEDRLSQSIVTHDMHQCIETLAVANASRIDQPGHLFNIACHNVKGSVNVDGLDAVSFAEAANTVYGLDRATQGLTISNAQRVQLALNSDAVVVRFGTMQNPMLEASSMSLSGPVIMARLACLPPQTDKIMVKVGSWHSIPVSVSRSGCRPPLKAYTDLKADLADVKFQITAGLEPAFAAMSQCTKRIIPPSRVLGDGTLPPPDPDESPVAWWDRMRYMWRGRMHCKMSDACFTISTALTPDADATKQRMDFRAKVFDLSSDPDAQLKLGLESTTATLLTHHHEKRSRPDAPLLRVPLFSLSNATITSNLNIELPNGRALLAHHIFPTIALGQRVHSEGVQGPVDINSVLAAQSMGANINISIRSLAIPGMGDTQAIPLAQAGVVYYSEEMMAFIRDLQSAFGSPPRYLRRAFKRSEDFWNRRTAKAASGTKLSLGELFQHLNMNIHGVDCAMQHHVVATGDLGEVHARPEDVNVECRWSFTSPNPQLVSADTANSLDMELALNSVQSLKSAYAFPYARGPAIKSMLSSLSVSATNVRLLRLEMLPSSVTRGSGLESVLDTGTFHPVHAQSDEHDGSVSGTSDGTNHCKAYGWEDMGSIRSLSVFQAPAPPSNTDEKRPIIVVSESAHLIISETSRQALGSAILHCKAPFGPRSTSSSTAPADTAAITDEERPSLQDASSDLTGRLHDLNQDPRSASSFQKGQLDLQELVLNAGQVVDLPAADYVSTTSGGDHAKSSQKKASSTSDVLDKASQDDQDSYALSWKVQVSDLQVAFLSTRQLGTAQFVADDANITHSIKNATEYTDAVASNAALYIMSHDVDMQNPVCWLEKGVSGYSLPDMSQQVNPIRLCVQPCQLQFRSQAAHAKSEQDTSHNAKNSPVQYLHMKVDMKSAHIQTSSYEYDVLTDVISHLIVSPMPQVPTMSRHQRSTPVDHEPSLCTLRNAMGPSLRNMWRQQHLLAAMNSCTPALGYLPRDPALLYSKPAPPPVPDLSFDFHYPSGGTPASPASESGLTPGTHLRTSSHGAASSRAPLKGLLARSPMHLNHGPLRRSPIRNDTHSQAGTSGLQKSARSLSARTPSSTPLTDPAFCPLRASVETMAATYSKLQASLDTAPGAGSSGAGNADSVPPLEAAVSPPLCTTPPSATGSAPHAWGGSRSTAPSPEHRPPLSAHRKSNSMGGRSLPPPMISDSQQSVHLARTSNSNTGAALSVSQSPVRGRTGLALSLDASPNADQSKGDQASKMRPPSPLKTGMRPADTTDTVPSLMTGKPRSFLPLDMDRVGEQAHLAGYEDAELNSQQRQIQLQLQFNQIRDYLSKSDADVFSKCIVPFLKADSYLQSAEISEDMFMVMLHTCLINWLDTDTATQEKILESLEHAMEKERLVLEEALIRRRRAEDLSHSVQLHLFIQQLSWTLHKPDGKPLVSVESSDISFSRTHHRDRTGYCKVQIRELNVRDLTASLTISKQLPKGMMLCKLKDPAWKKEGFLLVNVIRGRPTPDEVVYNHIDIKLHPLLVQLDGNMVSALTSFFRVQKVGADVDERRLDKVMGMSVIAKAERARSKLHLRQESIDEGSQVAPTSSMNLQGVGSVQVGSVLSLRPSLSVMSSMSGHDGDPSFHSYPPHRQHADPDSGLPMVAPVPRAGSILSSVPALDLQAVHTQSLIDSSAFRAHRGSMEARVRVSVEPRVHRYQNVTFSPTFFSVSLKVDKFARCQDKVIKVPDQRYQNMQNARPATLMTRYGWDLACSFLKGMLTISSHKSGLRQSVSTDAIKTAMTGDEEKLTPNPKSVLGKALGRMKKMGGAGSSSDKS